MIDMTVAVCILKGVMRDNDISDEHAVHRLNNDVYCIYHYEIINNKDINVSLKKSNK